MDRAELLGKENAFKLIIKFSVPTIIGLLISTFYSLIDRIFIGNSVGVLGIAGVTITFPIMLIMAACALLVGIGATTLVAINLGAKKVDEAEHILGNALSYCVLISVLLTILGLSCLTPLLQMLGANEDALPYARDYASIILLGTVFQLTSLGMNTLIRATGSPQKAMWTMLIGAISNVILAPLFIFGFKWGIKGAAFATVISQAISAVWVISHFIGPKAVLKLRSKYLYPRTDIALNVASIGIAPFATQIVESIFNTLMNNGLARYGGNAAVSSLGAVLSVYLVILMLIFGISQGIQPIIGFNFGAQKYDRVQDVLKSAMIIATAIAIVGFVLTRVFPAQILQAFDRDRNFVATGTSIMETILFSLPIIGLQAIGSSYFQAVRKAKQALFLALSRHLLFLIPGLLILPLFFQMFGVLVAVPIADLLATTVTMIFFGVEMYKINIMRKEQVALATATNLPSEEPSLSDLVSEAASGSDPVKIASVNGTRYDTNLSSNEQPSKRESRSQIRSARVRLLPLGQALSLQWQIQMLQGQAQMLQGHAQMLQGHAQILQEHALPLQGQAQMLQGQAQMLQGQAQMLQGQAQMLQGQAQMPHTDLYDQREQGEALHQPHLVHVAQERIARPAG